MLSCSSIKYVQTRSVMTSKTSTSELPPVVTITPEESLKWANENHDQPVEVQYRDKVSMSLLFLALGTAGIFFISSKCTTQSGH